MNMLKQFLNLFHKDQLRPRDTHIHYYNWEIELNYEEDKGKVSGKNLSLVPKVKLGDYLTIPTSQGKELFEIISIKISKNELQWNAKVKWISSQLCPNCLILYREDNLVNCPKCRIELVWKN